jgi:hypothetical protein
MEMRKIERERKLAIYEKVGRRGWQIRGKIQRD